MPAIALLQPNHSSAPILYVDAGRWADAPSAQGVEGKKVSAKAQEVYRHWSERAEVLLMRREAADEFSYEHVPPNRVFHVKTRYVYAGKGLPMSVDLDEE